MIPYNAVDGHCQSGNPRPNATTADPTISTLSHEHNETVTDPRSAMPGMTESTNSEDGVLCITSFGPGASATAPGAPPTTGLIHSRHYWLQEEWSDGAAPCQPRDEG